MKKLNIVYTAVLAGLFSLCGCSSAPKRPMVITEKYELSSTELENGNRDLAGGNFVNADKHFTEAYKLALSIDNSDLISRVLFSQIAYQTSMPGFEYSNTAETLLVQARRHAARADNCVILSAVCDIYEAHILIASASAAENQGADAEKLCIKNEKILEKDPYYAGFLYYTLGDALIIEKKYTDGETAYLKAADIHTKSRYLQEIGHDWYAVASARSLAGKKQSAIDALEQALAYDRNAENTAAIASDYLAAARVLAKAPATEEEKKAAAEKAVYAASMYRAVNLEESAKRCDVFVQNITK